MERILRLSLANIKKHKKQTVLLALLIMLCMAITSSACAGYFDMKDIFPRVAEQYAVHQNFMKINKGFYEPGFIDILKSDSRVTDAEHINTLYSMKTKYLDKTGEERALYMGVVTMDTHLRIETSPIESSLSEEERAALEHPIYLPYAARESLRSKFTEGDNFDIVVGSKLYSFTVAGFYESIFLPETNNGFQIIVSDSDYITLMSVLDYQDVLLFDCSPITAGDDVEMDFTNTVTDLLGKDIGYEIVTFTYNNCVNMSIIFIGIVLAIMMFMAVVILIASAVMIRFRITGDIHDQMQSIGVLEALGYTSKDISLSYTAEYLLIALFGIIPGTVLSFAILPVLHSLGQRLSGHHGAMHIEPAVFLITAAVIFAFAGVIAHIRSGMVRKYPPVQAFRKGIASHHFGKDVFPLRNTKSSVNLRLAMKGFVGSIRQNVGLTVCIAIAALAAVGSLIITDLFSTDFDVASRMTGVELSDINITTADYTDTEELAENIRHIPGVQKVLVGSFSLDISHAAQLYCYDRSALMTPVSYADFGVLEKLTASEGTLPVHDNEAAVSRMFASEHGLKTGDTLTVERNRVKKNYIVTGFVPSITNNGRNIYITHEGFRRIDPTFTPHAIDVFLEDGADKQEIKSVILDTYGKTISDTRKADASGNTAEERIRAVAEQKMAEMLANYDVTHAEYAVQIGDTVIAGSSGGFMIKDCSDLQEVMQTQIGGMFSAISMSAWAFLAVAAVVAAVIIVNLMEQTIRRQRRDLSIMMSVGYTSNDLMLQLALRILPAVVIAVILGTVGGIIIYRTVMAVVLGTAVMNFPLLITADVLMIAFCFVCGYLGAHRIKTISVTELMTE